MTDCHYCGDGGNVVSRFGAHQECWDEATRRTREGVCVKCSRNQVPNDSFCCSSCGNDAKFLDYPGGSA